MALTASKTSSTKDDTTLDEKSRHDSTFLDTKAEKALEEAAPALDESKILEGQRLVFAFIAMLLSVLLFALGTFFLFLI
jgi:hypothetical protein